MNKTVTIDYDFQIYDVINRINLMLYENGLDIQIVNVSESEESERQKYTFVRTNKLVRE